MGKIKKLFAVSFIWNVVVLFLLFFQSTIMFEIIKYQLFSNSESFDQMLEDSFLTLMKNKVIITVTIIISIILIELILYFVVNALLSRSFKKYVSVTETANTNNIKNLYRYYRFINIFMLFSIIVFFAMIGFYIFNILDISKSIVISQENKTLIAINEVLAKADIETIADLERVFEDIVIQIKSSNIYNLANTLENFVGTIFNLKNIWYTLTYAILGFGVFLNLRQYVSIKK